MQLVTATQPNPRHSPINGSPPSQPPPVLLFSMISCDMRYVFGQFGSWLCPLSASHAYPAYSLAKQQERQKSPSFGVSTVQQLKHQCVMNVIFNLNPNHSTIPAARKKISPIPAKTKTCLWTEIICTDTQDAVHKYCCFIFKEVCVCIENQLYVRRRVPRRLNRNNTEQNAACSSNTTECAWTS